METILIYPKSKEQVKLFEQMAKALKIPFEVGGKKAVEYEAMLKESYQEAQDGKVTIIATEDLWK